MNPLLTPDNPVLWKAAQTYVGLAYQPGVFDCADLAVHVQEHVFGRRVDLPANRPRPGGAMGQAREIKRLQAALAGKVAAPFTGCGVLFTESNGSAAPTWHIGTVFMQGGEVWVLHNSAKLKGAALQRLADLARFGLALEGFYEWWVAA